MQDTHEKDKDKEIQEQNEEISHFKLTLTHRQAKGLETASRELQRKIKALTESNDPQKIKASGPARMPTKHLSLTTRKSPCGNGTNTYDFWEMRIHKRVFHIHCSQRNFQNITSGLYTEAGMILEAEEIEEDDEE